MGGEHCNPCAKPPLLIFEAHGGLRVIFIVGIQSGCACFEGVGCPLVTRRPCLRGRFNTKLVVAESVRSSDCLACQFDGALRPGHGPSLRW